MRTLEIKTYNMLSTTVQISNDWFTNIINSPFHPLHIYNLFKIIGMIMNS